MKHGKMKARFFVNHLQLDLLCLLDTNLNVQDAEN